MANEAIKRYSESAAGDVIQDYTVADDLGLEKGCFLKSIDPRSVSLADTAQQPIVGILAREKLAGDGRTRVAVYKKGFFDVVASTAIIQGAPLMFAGGTGFSNTVMAANAGASGSGIIGYAEEAASAAEVFVMRLDL